MVFTPEMSGLLDRDKDRAAGSLTREEDDRVLASVREAAAKHGIGVHLGSLAVLRGDGKLANRGFVIDDQGAIRARYDKMHLFDVDLPSGESWRESASYSAGERAVTVETPLGVLGLAICDDLRFPDLFRTLSDAGATILAVPAAFTRPTGAAHWHVLLRARAIEAAAFVIAAAQTGVHEDGRATYGHSLAIDPWGEVLLDMGESAGLGFAVIDPARVAAARERVPVLRHRRAIPPVEAL
jgi:predicted amidohydrolase